MGRVGRAKCYLLNNWLSNHRSLVVLPRLAQSVVLWDLIWRILATIPNWNLKGVCTGAPRAYRSSGKIYFDNLR